MSLESAMGGRDTADHELAALVEQSHDIADIGRTIDGDIWHDDSLQWCYVATPPTWMLDEVPEDHPLHQWYAQRDRFLTATDAEEHLASHRWHYAEQLFTLSQRA